MATHTSIPAWKIPRTEKPVGDSPWGRKQLDRTEPLSTRTWRNETRTWNTTALFYQEERASEGRGGQLAAPHRRHGHLGFRRWPGSQGPGLNPASRS